MMTNSIMNMQQDVLAATRATAALDVVARRKLKMPKKVDDATNVVKQLDLISAEADPSAPELPADPARVKQVLVDAANRRVTAVELRKLAAELQPGALFACHAAIQDAGVEWVAALKEAFDGHLDALRAAAPAAPKVAADEVSNLGTAAFGAWNAVVTTVMELEELVADRATMAGLMREGRSSHWGTTLPLIAMISPPAGSGGEVTTAFQSRIEIRYATEITDATLRWHAWLALEERGWLRLKMAGPHELGSRIALVNAWPRAFEAAAVRDGGASFERAVADSGNMWRTMAVVR